MRCCLVAACDFNEKDFKKRWREHEFDFTVAVDGGYEYLRELDCSPDLVIGDFDSLGYVPDRDGVIVHPTHKDESDLELSFDYALTHGFKSVVAYGCLGGRLDHTIGNMQIAARYSEAGIDVLLIGLDVQVKLLSGPANYDVPAREGTVSVFSACDCSQGVTETGMEYPLNDADLSNRTTLCLSNELKGEPASISVESGTLYIVHPPELH